MACVGAGIGASEVADSREAGRRAAADAVRDLGEATPALVVVYASVRFDLAELLAGVREATGSTPLIGASSSGHFFDGRMMAAGCGVAVLLLSQGPYRFGVASVESVSGRGFAAGRELAEAARTALGENRRGYAAMLLLADGLQPEQQTLISGIYAVGGAKVPVVGGAAGDDHRLIETVVFHDGNVLSDAAVGVWIDSPHPLNVVSSHGWQPHGLPVLVTRCDGLIVREIGGRPSNEVMEVNFRSVAVVEHDEKPEPVSWRSAYALGLIEPDGSLLVRGAYRDEEGLMRTFVPVPAYTAVQLVSATPDDLLGVVNTVATGAIGSGGAGVLLGFSCVGRLDALGERSGDEPKLLQEAAGDVRTFGFFTYGEFARTKSVAGVHNATLTALAL